MTIGITQRVELCKDYHEIRDCLDQEWTNLLCKANIDFILVPNSLDDIDSWLEKKNLEGFILTGGNDLSHLPDAKNPAPSRDETEKKILKWSVKNKTKVLGVCRGMQLINCFFSGSLCKVNGHAGFNHSIDILNDKYNFNSQSIRSTQWGKERTSRTDRTRKEIFKRRNRWHPHPAQRRHLKMTLRYIKPIPILKMT